MKNATHRAATELGDLLRYWRAIRGKSQLDLSVDAGVSQRHISFIESGRSVPSREALLGLARVLDIPLRDRNGILLAAGYAPLYFEGAWDALEMQSINKALERILRQHEPFPAIVLDRHWNVLLTNQSAPLFFNSFSDQATHKKPRNVLHLIFDPERMRPYVVNWEEVAKGLFERVYRESVGHVIDDATRDLLNELLAYPDVKSEWKNVLDQSNLPVVPISLLKDGVVLNYFSMISTVGTPRTVAAQELRIETMFPADPATEMQHLALMASITKST